MLETPLMNNLGRYLDLTARRQSIISGNISNIDTPGYQTQDINFQHELQRLMNGNETSADAIPTQKVPGLIARPDGNNVSLEREGLLLGQTHLQFRTGVELIKAEFHKLQTAINEGGK
jgi:flagellar basal-body rod protein FlgB